MIISIWGKIKIKLIALSLFTVFLLTAPTIHATILSSPQNVHDKSLIEDDVKILFVLGGRSIHAWVQNVGEGSLFKIPWEISLWHPIGGCFGYTEGTIEQLDAGEITTISYDFQSKLISLAIVFLNVGGVRKSLDAWWIWSFIIIGLLGRWD